MSLATAAGSYQIALIVLASAVLAVVAKRLGQPSVVAYLVTGLLLGPAVLGAVEQSSFTSLISELGLAFLLFLIGIEIEFDQVKEIITEIASITVFQIAALAVFGAGIGLLLRFTLMESAIIGVAFSFSSTAVVIKLLSDRDELGTLHGKIDTGVLLFQDLVVVLALTAVSSGASVNSIVQGAAGLFVMVLLVAPLTFYLARNYLDSWFRAVAGNQHIFFVHAVAWMFLMVEIASYLGTSVEIGAFVAGLSIAQIPYSSEVRHRVKPLTDLFMALFFVNVGLGLTSNIFSVFNEALIACILLIPAKFAALFVLVDRSEFTPETAFRSSIGMVQVSEFALVLGAAALSQNLIGTRALEFITLTAIISIGFSSYLLQYSDRISESLKPLLDYLSTEGGREPGVETLSGHVLVIGYDALGREVAEAAAEYRDVVVVDRDPENVEELAESPYEYVYGDFRGEEIRKTARVGRADMVVCSARGRVLNETVVQDSEKGVFVTAENEEEAAELYDLGAHFVILDDRDSGEALGEMMVEALENPVEFSKKSRDLEQRALWGGERSL